MTKQVFILATPIARANATQAVRIAPDGFMVTISEPVKKRIQEEKYHAMIRDISKVALFMGEKLDEDDWKRLLVDMFAKVMRDLGTPLHNDGRVIPSLDFLRVVQLGIQTRDFYVSEGSSFIEYLYSYGTDINVVWTEPKEVKDLR